MMTSNFNSEYENSYKCIESLCNDYEENLKFRINKRNNEYSHQPFVWGCDDRIKNVIEQFMENRGYTGVKNDKMEVPSLKSKECNKNMLDVSTQTEKHVVAKIIEQKKAFVPYGIGGSPDLKSVTKRTFNVKSECDVYPSATRAEAQRRQRLMSKFDRPRLQSVQLKRNDRNHINESELYALSSGKSHHKNLNHDRINYHVVNNWSSEYSQKYPIYPHSIYVRSASTAASRFRPFSSASSRQPSTVIKSLMPSTPVLLSSRGSEKYTRTFEKVDIMDTIKTALKSKVRKHSSSFSKSRSRSKSSGFCSPRRKNRYNSRERNETRLKFRNRRDENYRLRNPQMALRRSNSLSPLARRKRHGNDKLSFPDTESRLHRLRKPEVFGDYGRGRLNSNNDRNRIPIGYTNDHRDNYMHHVVINLTERFLRLSKSGTNIFNKSKYGRFGHSHRLPHLILTNNTKLPPATLMRQAKEISILIERTFSVDRNTVDSEEHKLQCDKLIIPRRANEGHKPVFDRQEIKFYNTNSEESMIFKRLSDCISSISRYSKPNNQDRRKKQIDYHDISEFIGPGRFYGSRVDERLSSSKTSFPLDPADIPKGVSYYLHDNRSDDSFHTRRRWNDSHSTRNSRSEYSTGFNRDKHSDNSSRAPLKFRSGIPRDGTSENQWLHDKFDEVTGCNVSPSKLIPKPVPAPKPILWSTIGKDCLNDDLSKEKHVGNYSPNSVINHSPIGTDTSSPRAMISSKVDISCEFIDNEKYDMTAGTFNNDDLRLDAETSIDDSKVL